MKGFQKENSRFFHFSDVEKEKIGCFFPENRGFDLEKYLLFSGIMKLKRKVLCPPQVRQNAGKPYLANSGGLSFIRTRLWRRAFPRCPRGRG